MYNMCHIWQIFEKSSLETPVATWIGMDNPDNIPGEYVGPFMDLESGFPGFS